MSVASPVRVGVIGVGSLGFHHARLLRVLPGARLVGIFDADRERAAAVSAELEIRSFADLESLLSAVDAAIIAVPTLAHADVALAAIEKRVHLLVEKPLASTLTEADSILNAAAESGVMVATGHVERFNGVLAAAEHLLGTPRFIESHRLAPFGPRGTDVAVVLDLMIHDIDLVLSLVGEEVEGVDAVGIPVLTPNIDIANARLRFRGGAAANITASRVSRERMRKLRIFQNTGYLSLDFAGGSGEFLRLREGFDVGEHLQNEPVAEELPSLEHLVERIELWGDEKEPLQRELESFLAAVRGEGELVVSGAAGRRALAVALQIVERIEDHVVDASSAEPEGARRPH